MEGEWQKAWTSAKQSFEKSTGKKKPSNNFLLIFRRSGMEPVLETLDKTYTLAIQKLPRQDICEQGGLTEKDKTTSAKALNEFQKAVAKAEKAAQGYGAELGKAAAKEQESKALADDIKILRKELKAIVTDARAAYAHWTNVAEERSVLAEKKNGKSRPWEGLISALRNSIKLAGVWTAKGSKDAFSVDITGGAKEYLKRIRDLLRMVEKEATDNKVGKTAQSLAVDFDALVDTSAAVEKLTKSDGKQKETDAAQVYFNRVGQILKKTNTWVKTL